MVEHASRNHAMWTNGNGSGANGASSTHPFSFHPSLWVGVAALAALSFGLAVSSAEERPILFATTAILVAAALLVIRAIDAMTAGVVVVLGEGEQAARVAEVIRTMPPRAGAGRAAVVRRAANWTEAAQVVAATRCRELVVATGVFAPSAPVVDATGRYPASYTAAEAIERRLGLVPLDLVEQTHGFDQIGAASLGHGLYEHAKRALDLAAVLVLGALVLPLIPLIALAIRLDSPGPIFYRQIRVGHGGAPFEIIKFRSMRRDAERGGAQWAQPGDARATRVGLFMRRTHIDELPQLWNVLKGEMTMVGPRPERPEFTAVLEQEVPHFAKRYAVKPGVTGWQQVRNGYTSTVEGAARKLEYDLYYLKHASVGLDLRILLETVAVVLRKAGR